MTPSIVSEYAADIDESRRADIEELDRLIRETVPELELTSMYGMLAYGPFHYRYASGHEGDGCRIGVANRKNYISLHICANDENGYVAEGFKPRFPKANIGKGCVRFKRLSDLDTEALKELLHAAAKPSPSEQPI